MQQFLFQRMYIAEGLTPPLQEAYIAVANLIKIIIFMKMVINKI